MIAEHEADLVAEVGGGAELEDGVVLGGSDFGIVDFESAANAGAVAVGADDKVRVAIKASGEDPLGAGNGVSRRYPFSNLSMRASIWPAGGGKGEDLVAPQDFDAEVAEGVFEQVLEGRPGGGRRGRTRSPGSRQF